MANEQNLHPCKKGETHNPNGRPKKLSTIIDGLTPESKEKVYNILHQAIKMKNVKEASQFIMAQDGTDCEYGIVLQLAAKGLTGKMGWVVLNDILDRLFGKPKIIAEAKVGVTDLPSNLDKQGAIDFLAQMNK